MQSRQNHKARWFTKRRVIKISLNETMYVKTLRVQIPTTIHVQVTACNKKAQILGFAVLKNSKKSTKVIFWIQYDIFSIHKGFLHLVNVGIDKTLDDKQTYDFFLFNSVNFSLNRVNKSQLNGPLLNLCWDRG